MGLTFGIPASLSGLNARLAAQTFLFNKSYCNTANKNNLNKNNDRGGKLRFRTKIDFFKLGYLYHKILMDNKAKKITKP